ncbi:hypothetical protein IM697_10020 [Streptomyces ferrugineus]|uniref:AAA+ ATPase domain-containing protein n=1 Tax=Streptomyces ferrugineus TaxID=1413221 RepID=A0A7M2SSI5_9ACTN|nr:ATP-binding protein [Streptomyces ferrugineus]QOV38675.1 hypothetical protein IM697_10020 [Streptomyces ferrugineus]
MAAPTTGPVADFCAALGRLVSTCRVSQREIADALGLSSTSSVSELLAGRRRKVPEWDVVRTIVGLCAERHGGGAPPEGMSLEVKWWKSRHAELERTAETARGHATSGPSPVVPAPPPVPVAVPPGAPVSAPDATACAGMGVDEAVRLLAGGRIEATPAVYALMSARQGGQDRPRILGDLLADFPARVRAAHGVARAALIQAARVVLVAAAVVRNSDPAQVHNDIYRLTEGGHAAHTPALTGLGSDQDDVLSPIAVSYAWLAGPLARSCPEFALGAGLSGAEPGNRATTTTGLTGLGSLLSEFAVGDGPPTSPAAVLRSPIAALDSPGPRLPSLAEGYITPRFRLAAAPREARAVIASDKWWDEQPLHDDIEQFLAAHFLGLPALLAPLVVLGHPGAGKSLLTKLLTARLPAREFRTLRVELRHTPAEQDVQAQLEHALRRATGREIGWPDWAEQESGPLLVVLLDGFDELLQAGARKLGQARQWGYLQEIEEFQKREARQGRPLIVIVTSRTVVADRADIPAASQVLRLEPFDEREIDHWIRIWNTANKVYFAQTELLPLSPEVVRPHRDLAAQPLLLLMLALYDAVGNALYRLQDKDITRTQLYDQLLTEFVRRQVDKDGPLPPAEADMAVDRELHRLSVIAISMFHRGTQAISGEEADRDLRALGESNDGSGLLFGRFFFVHEAQAVVTEERLRSYEFMHATFGEHLAARLIEKALRGLVDSGSPWDDGELYALLSFAPLTDRAQLVQNLRDMLATWPRGRARPGLLPPLISFFRAAAWDPEHRGSVGYAPVRLRRAYRDAVYEANLVLVAVLAVGEVYASDLVDDSEGAAAGWRRHALGWQAQLSPTSWRAFSSTLHPERRYRAHPLDPSEGDGDLRITTRRTPLVDHDVNWPVTPSPPQTRRSLSDGLEERLADHGAVELIERILFVGDVDSEHLLHIGYPLLLQWPSAVSQFVVTVDDRLTSPVQPLVALLTRDVYSPETLPVLYTECFDHVRTLPDGERASYLEAVLRQLVHDAPALPDKTFASLLTQVHTALMRYPSLTSTTVRLLLDCVHHALERGSPDMAAPLENLRTDMLRNDHFVQVLLMMTQLARSTRTWRWWNSPPSFDAGHYNNLLHNLDLRSVATTHPTALIDLLRLTAELGLDDWLVTHTSEILAALPREAFDLFRPSDLPRLRAALPEGAYSEQFEEVERAWRAHE